MNLDLSVVADEAELAEFVHEMADTGSGDANHLRQYFRCGTPSLPKISEQQKQARKSQLARIE